MFPSLFLLTSTESAHRPDAVPCGCVPFLLPCTPLSQAQEPIQSYSIAIRMILPYRINFHQPRPQQHTDGPKSSLGISISAVALFCSPSQSFSHSRNLCIPWVVVMVVVFLVWSGGGNVVLLVPLRANCYGDYGIFRSAAAAATNFV